MPLPPSIPREVHTPRLILKAANLDFVDSVLEAIHASWPELNIWAPWADDAQKINRDYIAKLMTELEANFTKPEKALYYYAFTHADNRFVMVCELGAINWRVPSAIVGYWADTRQTGNGYAQEAINALVQTAFGPLGIKRLSMTIGENNGASRRIAHKLGFHQEGYHPLYLTHGNGTPMNVHSYALFTPALLPPLEVSWT